MSEVAGLTSKEAKFLLHMRQIEEMYRQGFVGSMTLHVHPDRSVKFEFRAFDGTWVPDVDRRLEERRTLPRDGEDRRKL